MPEMVEINPNFTRFKPREGEPIGSLADAANAFTYQRKHVGIKLPDACIGIQLRYRQKLRQAQRFVLDDDSTRLCCSLSHEQDRLEGWSFLARLPHDPMWIEYNLHAKVREMERLGALTLPFDPEVVSPRIGYLLYREDPKSDSPRWIAHCFCEDSESDRGYLAYTTWMFDPEGDPRTPLRGSTLWGLPTLSLRPGFPKVQVTMQTQDNNGVKLRCMADPEIIVSGLYRWNKDLMEVCSDGKTLGIPVKFRDDGTFDATGTDAISGPEWLMPKMAVLVDPWWEAFAAKHMKKADLTKAVLKQCQEERGAFRYLMTLLASINGLPKHVKPINPSKVRRTIGINAVPYFSHNNLTITIPGEERVVRAKTILDKETRNAIKHRRWHMVRGHWRVIEFSKRTYLCRHTPTMVEHGLGICTRCELLVRWIDAHERGDQALGVVDHTYNVTT
jgi:hypothetical protein